MSPADRAQIEDLLQDPALSYREIARKTGISDWSIRRVSRELDGDVRPMRTPRGASSYASDIRDADADDGEHSGLVGRLIAAAAATLLCIGFWRGRHSDVPPDTFPDFSPEN